MRNIKHEAGALSLGNGLNSLSPPVYGSPASKLVRLRSAKGFSLLELMVVIIIIGFLIMVFVNKESGVWVYQEQAEKAAMVGVANAIQSALVMKYGHLMIIGNGEKEIAALAAENPMQWMAKVPDNYAGELDDPLPGDVTPGEWFFDLHSRELVYVPKRTDNLKPNAQGDKWIRYRVKLVYDSASKRSGKGLIQGVLFEPVEPYHWLE